jgi:hypothetical protein
MRILPPFRPFIGRRAQPAQPKKTVDDPAALAAAIIVAGERRRGKRSADEDLPPVGSLAREIVLAARKARSK